MPLTAYRTLGRSGLVVSPLALGTMTFGTDRWGADEAASRAIFHAYREAGGNFVDTADIYAGGAGEEMVGRLIARDRARATRWCSPPSSASTRARARCRPPRAAAATPMPAARAPRTSTARSRARSGASGPTTSTSTGCTSGTA